jgi:hypothetical protein
MKFLVRNFLVRNALALRTSSSKRFHEDHAMIEKLSPMSAIKTVKRRIAASNSLNILFYNPNYYDK